MTITDPAVSLWDGVESFDAEAVDEALADLLRDLPLQRAVSEVILPFLQEIGDRWESGTLSVAHEHFFTSLLTRRLTTLATSSATRRVGAPVVILGCPPGERHEIALLCFGLLLGEQGCRVRYLGADTPVTAIVGAARTSAADAVVLAATRRTALTAHASALRKLGERHTVYVAGRGADHEVAHLVGAQLLPPDPVAAVGALAVRGTPQG
ncbi:hypothetical protein EXE58_05000 [Nocardioides seonyuensis]|uniref:B12-binding domain-containing protein n=1 Tax=Nocardioides seonyuensis TaxID=2518371 RepID=A0A4P7IEB4_9ACTN|nr:B12-binding domain-containing protein [Nocardioides seonyuensis]QBX54883.1 hypothetical protein EXE58_05000 [Nocardioides seonyuensis]